MMAQDLESLCELISKSNEFQIPERQKIETPMNVLELVDEMRKRQHELFKEMFDCIMNCLRVIQCDMACINHFLMDDEESILDDEVKASRKIVNSINILA